MTVVIIEVPQIYPPSAVWRTQEAQCGVLNFLSIPIKSYYLGNHGVWRFVQGRLRWLISHFDVTAARGLTIAAMMGRRQRPVRAKAESIPKEAVVLGGAQVKAQADGKASAAGELGPVNFGPKYEQHVQELQKQLDDASLMCVVPWATPCCRHAASADIQLGPQLH